MELVELGSNEYPMLRAFVKYLKNLNLPHLDRTVRGTPGNVLKNEKLYQTSLH
jgi:hypothetical protein